MICTTTNPSRYTILIKRVWRDIFHKYFVNFSVTIVNKMSSNDRAQYSPFFKAKRFFKFFNLLGFPLKLDDTKFDNFKFNPWVEHPKSIFYYCNMGVGFGYTAYLFMKATDSWNMYDAFAIKLGMLGLSELDMVVMVGYPGLSVISAAFYFCQLINKKDKINKISRLLTDVNVGMAQEWEALNLDSGVLYKSIYMKTIVVGMIAIISGVTLGFSYITSFFFSSTEQLSMTEKILFWVINLTLNPFIVYPPQTVAADFMMTHLLLEVTNSFTKLKDILKCKCVIKHRSINTDENNGDQSTISMDNEEHLRYFKLFMVLFIY